MTEVLKGAISHTNDKWISISMFIILNIFLIWIFLTPLIKLGAGVKIVSIFYTLIFFFSITLEVLLLHKIFMLFTGQESSISLRSRHLVILLVIILALIIMIINLNVYSLGINSLLCDKVKDKPSQDCNSLDFRFVYSQYTDILTCDNIYSAGKGEINSIFSFLKNKQASCFLGKAFKI